MDKQVLMVALVLDGPSLEIMEMEVAPMVMLIIQAAERDFTLDHKIQQVHQGLMREDLGKDIEVQASQGHMVALVVAVQAQTTTMIVIKAVVVVTLVEVHQLMVPIGLAVAVALTMPAATRIM